MYVLKYSACFCVLSLCFPPLCVCSLFSGCITMFKFIFQLALTDLTNGNTETWPKGWSFGLKNSILVPSRLAKLAYFLFLIVSLLVIYSSWCFLLVSCLINKAFCCIYSFPLQLMKVSAGQLVWLAPSVCLFVCLFVSHVLANKYCFIVLLDIRIAP